MCRHVEPWELRVSQCSLKMNNAAAPPDNGQYSASQQRPFFYAQPTAQLPFPNPWYLGQLYNPYCVPGPGFRGGNPYFPFYSVALHEYPGGYYVPQQQMNTRLNRRPNFNPYPASPMFYHATRFRHYSSPGRRTETKETQTDPRQPEYIPQMHNGSDSKGCDAGSQECHSSGISCPENESNLENVGMSISPVTTIQERDFHKSPCNSSQYRNMPPGSYAYEKEEVRIEYGSGSPAAIQMWKSYKETIPIFDVAVKELPDNVVQRDLYCEGVLYGPHAESEEITVQGVVFNKECKTSLSPKLCLDVAQETETQTGIQSIELNETLKLRKPSPELNATERELPNSLAEHCVCPDKNEQGGDAEVTGGNKKSAKCVTNGDYLARLVVVPESEISTLSGCDGEVRLDSPSNGWTEDVLENLVPTPSWVTCFDNIESNHDYDAYMSQRKQKRQSILSITSEELSSRDEGSSVENNSISYLVPDYMLRKGLYAFRKSAEITEREKIKSAGSLKEEVFVKAASSQYDNGHSVVRDKAVSRRPRRIGVPVRELSRRKMFSVKKKLSKSQSLSEPEDSEEFWVMEEENLHNCEESEDEYYLQGNLPHGQLDLIKGSFFKQIAQKRILWKPPKGTIPAQLISWPVREKTKVKKKGYEPMGQLHRLTEKALGDYANYEKKQVANLERGYKEMSEQKRSLPKSLGGKPQKKTTGATVEEYWVGRGAKPKFTEPAYYLQDTAKIKEQDKPKKKGTSKSSKRKQARTDPEEVETWEFPRSILYRGCALKKGGFVCVFNFYSDKGVLSTH
uniref:Bucky ball n=1 Tax=Leptobrachium leishanense TaxID=445787 RepID=A0A8C5MBI4_9ANUR